VFLLYRCRLLHLHYWSILTFRPYSERRRDSIMSYSQQGRSRRKKLRSR